MWQGVNWSLNPQCSPCISKQFYPYISCCTRVHILLRILELERDILSDSVVWRSHAYNSWPATERC